MKAVYIIDASVTFTASAVDTNDQTQVTVWERKRDLSQYADVREANSQQILFIWLQNTILRVCLRAINKFVL